MPLNVGRSLRFTVYRLAGLRATNLHSVTLALPRLTMRLHFCRVISRAPGLKLVVQTLLSSLRPIGNIVLICCTFFIIFGILGVQVIYVKWIRVYYSERISTRIYLRGQIYEDRSTRIDLEDRSTRIDLRGQIYEDRSLRVDL